MNFGGGRGFSAPRMGGGNFSAPRMGGSFSAPRMGNQGNFGGRGFSPAPSFRAPSMNVPQMRGGNLGGAPAMRNFNSPNIGNAFRGGQTGGPNGMRIQPGPNFPGGQNFGRMTNIQPNRGLYGRGGNFGPPGIAGRMQQGFGQTARIGSLPHTAGRAPVFGNTRGFNQGWNGRQIGQMPFGGRRIGGGNFGNAGWGRGNNFAQFQGRRGGWNQWNGGGNWGINRGNWHNVGWNNGWNRGNWGANYRNVAINNNYYGWYNRPWGGGWGWGWGGWYPFYRSAFFWGLGPFFSPWGWGGGWGGGYGLGYGGFYGGGYGPYFNPYCAYGTQIDYVSPLGGDYYTQPLTLPQATVTQNDNNLDPQTRAAYALVEQGRQLFRGGDYRGALAKYDAAIPDLKTDPVVHELRALALFALADYHEAAATLNALLAVAPGMDWTSMRNQYPDLATYTNQLRALEGFIRENPNDAAGRFVLGYHYLVTNYPEAALVQFQKVVELEPKDVVAKKMVETLQKKDDSQPNPAGEAAVDPALQTDLVGRWRAKSKDGTTFDVTFDDAGGFVWKAAPPQGPAAEQSGKYTATPDRLILDPTAEQDSLISKVESRGPDHFRLWLTDEAYLAFRRDGVNTPEPEVVGKPDPAAPVLKPAPIPQRVPAPPLPANPGIKVPLPEEDPPADASPPGI